MSLLLAHGHPTARAYTIGQLFDEAELVFERQEDERKIFMQQLQLTVSTIPNMAAPQASKDTLPLFMRWINQD